MSIKAVTAWPFLEGEEGSEEGTSTREAGGLDGPDIDHLDAGDSSPASKKHRRLGGNSRGGERRKREDEKKERVRLIEAKKRGVTLMTPSETE